jgi:hypothetical protein
MAIERCIETLIVAPALLQRRRRKKHHAGVWCEATKPVRVAGRNPQDRRRLCGEDEAVHCRAGLLCDNVLQGDGTDDRGAADRVDVLALEPMRVPGTSRSSWRSSLTITTSKLGRSAWAWMLRRVRRRSPDRRWWGMTRLMTGLSILGYIREGVCLSDGDRTTGGPLPFCHPARDGQPSARVSDRSRPLPDRAGPLKFRNDEWLRAFRRARGTMPAGVSTQRRFFRARGLTGSVRVTIRNLNCPTFRGSGGHFIRIARALHSFVAHDGSSVCEGANHA